MRQAAVFEGGLMLVVGEICELMGAGLVVEIPLESLRKILEGIPLADCGVETVRSYRDMEQGVTLTVRRNEGGFLFDVSSVRGVATLGVVYRYDAVNLKDLVFPRYTYPSGFDFPPEPEAKEPEVEAAT